MKKIMFLPLFVMLLASVSGCDNGSDQAVEQRMRAERAAQAAAETRRIEGEKQAGRERQVMESKLEHEARKAFLAVVLALGLGCLAAGAILWAARERRIRMTLTEILRRIHRKGG